MLVRIFRVIGSRLHYNYGNEAKSSSRRGKLGLLIDRRFLPHRLSSNAANFDVGVATTGYAAAII